MVRRYYAGITRNHAKEVIVVANMWIELVRDYNYLAGEKLTIYSYY